MESTDGTKVNRSMVPRGEAVKMAKSVLDNLCRGTISAIPKDLPFTNDIRAEALSGELGIRPALQVLWSIREQAHREAGTQYFPLGWLVLLLCAKYVMLEACSEAADLDLIALKRNRSDQRFCHNPVFQSTNGLTAVVLRVHRMMSESFDTVGHAANSLMDLSRPANLLEEDPEVNAEFALVQLRDCIREGTDPRLALTKISATLYERAGRGDCGFVIRLAHNLSEAKLGRRISAEGMPSLPECIRRMYLPLCLWECPTYKDAFARFDVAADLRDWCPYRDPVQFGSAWNRLKLREFKIG